MGRKKKNTPDLTPKPVSQQVDLSRKVKIEEGRYHIFQNGVGFVYVKYRASFEDDPKGCRGYGDTPEIAKSILYEYEYQ